MNRIAITGGSSVGKTTLFDRLSIDSDIRRVISTFIPEGARTLLREMGVESFDSLSREELREFQRRFFEWKQVQELSASNYLVDRSFVDVAAVWIERDTYDQPRVVQDEILVPCRSLAARYSLHIHIPDGIIGFHDDGVREGDVLLHQRISRRIHLLLDEWQLPRVTVHSQTVEERATEVKAALGIRI